MVGVAAVLFGLVAGVASAQGAKKVAFETSFGFVVNDKVMPAGRYEIEALTGQGPMSLVIRNLGTNDKMIVKTATRLADLGGKEPTIVFDKTADTQYLAEVHIPGIDGFDVQHAPGEHGHTKVTAKQ